MNTSTSSVWYVQLDYTINDNVVNTYSDKMKKEIRIFIVQVGKIDKNEEIFKKTDCFEKQ